MKKRSAGIVIAFAAGFTAASFTASAEVIATVDSMKNRIMLFADRIGCPAGTKSVGIWNLTRNEVVGTGCWFYDERNTGSEIAMEMHGIDHVFYFDEDSFERVSNFKQRATAQ